MKLLTMDKIGILGYGEIGKAIAKFYKKPLIRDIDKNEFEQLDVLHICIPYSKEFIKIVKSNIKEYGRGSLVIIHSTVPIGTTEKLGYKFAVHSPVRGVHPELYEGIKTFVKYIGADFAGTGRLALEHYEKIGIKGVVVYKSRTTEALKIWSTTQYGLFITLQKEIHKWCEENELNYDFIYTHANNTYNEGYMKLGRPDVIRPILKQKDGGIGGHCVLNNLKFLKSRISKFIKNENIRNSQ